MPSVIALARQDPFANVPDAHHGIERVGVRGARACIGLHGRHESINAELLALQLGVLNRTSIRAGTQELAAAALEIHRGLGKNLA